MIEINFDKVLYRFPKRELAHVDIGIFYDERKNVIDKNQEFPKKEEEGANLFRRKREVAF